MSNKIMNSLTTRTWPLIVAGILMTMFPFVTAQTASDASLPTSLAAADARESATPAQPTPAKPSHRAVSEASAAALSAGFRYDPPPPPKPVDEEVDLRDVDKPRNGIVRLPTYVVTAARPSVFDDRSLYSKDNLEKLAKGKYLSKLDTNVLNHWTIPVLGMPNEDRAMMIYRDEERLKNKADTDAQAALVEANGETTRAKEIKKEGDDMYLRRTEFIEPAAK